MKEKKWNIFKISSVILLIIAVVILLIMSYHVFTYVKGKTIAYVLVLFIPASLVLYHILQLQLVNDIAFSEAPVKWKKLLYTVLTTFAFICIILLFYLIYDFIMLLRVWKSKLPALTIIAIFSDVIYAFVSFYNFPLSIQLIRFMSKQDQSRQQFIDEIGKEVIT